MENLCSSFKSLVGKKHVIIQIDSFPEPYTRSKTKIKVELDLSNYATISGLKNATGVDISKCATEVDLASLKSEFDDLDIDKLKTIPVYLNKLNDVVKNEGVIKTVYDKLV